MEHLSDAEAHKILLAAQDMKNPGQAAMCRSVLKCWHEQHTQGVLSISQTVLAEVEHVLGMPGPSVKKGMAFIDEAGAGGKLRNLAPRRDGEILLICAIVVPDIHTDGLRAAVADSFSKFKAAAPPGAKLHITDAFAPDAPPEWKATAVAARSEILGLLSRVRPAVIYEARRLALARSTFEMEDRFRKEGEALRKPGLRYYVPREDEHVIDSLLLGPSLKLDAFAEDNHLEFVDLLTDHLTPAEVARIEAATRRASSTGQPQSVKFATYDSATKTRTRHENQIQLKLKEPLPYPVAATHLGNVAVAGKEELLTFAVDVVANTLFDHLSALPVTAPLNAPASVSGWMLARDVYGVRDDAFEDVY